MSLENFERSRNSHFSGNNTSGFRVFISNIPFSYKWQEIKDLLQQKVDGVMDVKLYKDKSGKFNSCCTVTFETQDAAKKSITILNNCIVNNRKLNVYEDNIQRDASGCKLSKRSSSSCSYESPRDCQSGDIIPVKYSSHELFGLKPEFLRLLNIHPPLVNRIVVSNLDPQVDEIKLKNVFELAGNIVGVKIIKDEEFVSGIIEYTHPCYSVQAISMLHGEKLYDRPMHLDLDRIERPSLATIPSGLKSLGKGLGPNGITLFNLDGICADGSKYFEYSMNSARGSSSIDDLSKIKSDDDLLPKSNTVVVKNLPSNSSRQSLIEYFSECGDVEQIFMSSDSTFQGRAFVQFHSQSQAEMAITLKHLSKFNECFIEVELF